MDGKGEDGIGGQRCLWEAAAGIELGMAVAATEVRHTSVDKGIGHGKGGTRYHYGLEPRWLFPGGRDSVF